MRTGGDARRKVCVLGGSSAFTPAFAAALAGAGGSLPPVELRLVGRRRERAERVARVCAAHFAAVGAPHAAVAPLGIDEALAGADVVLVQVRVGGFAGRSIDENFPLRFGVPGDESIGPGGLASAIRAFPVVRRLVLRALRLAPAAPVVLLTNPLGILLRALGPEAQDRLFGLCELPEATLRRAAALVGLRPDEVDADYAGLNHQGAFVSVRDRLGRERMPAILEAIGALADRRAFSVPADRMLADGLLHLPYARLWLDRRFALERKRRGPDRGRQLAALAERLHRAYERAPSGRLPRDLRRRDTSWNELALVPCLRSLLRGTVERLAVSALNGGHLPFLPADAVVEKWGAQVAGRSPPPRPVLERRPAGWASFMRRLRRADAFERAASEAARSPSLAAVERALALDPIVEEAGADPGALARATLEAARAGVQRAAEVEPAEREP